MSTKPPQSTGGQPPTRRERRAAERSARRTVAVSAPAPPAWRSPMALLTIGALAAGAIAVVLLVLASGGLGGPTLAAVATPDIPPPAVELRDGRSLGRADAPVSIEVWGDPQCPGCGQFVRDIEPLLISRYVTDGTVRLTYRDRLVVGLGPQESRDAAVGMRIADDLGDKFWDYHDIVYHNQDGEGKGAFSRDRLARMAELVGLDPQAFRRELDDPRHAEAVAAEDASGAAAGIRSTPTLVIEGRLFPGGLPWAQLSDAIDAIAAASPAP